MMKVDHNDVVLSCTICSGEYNPGTEGGVSGYIGILPVNFCPTCKAGIFDFVEQQCERCSTFEDSESKN